jgi:hypothetical protein
LAVLTHTRTVVYIAASAAIWFAEDYVFTRALGFNAAQTAVVTAYFVALFAVAIRLVFRARSRARAGGYTGGEFTVAKLVSMAPALTLVVGSFAALPVIIGVLVAGSIFS